MIDFKNKNVILLTAVVVTFLAGFILNDPLLLFEQSYAKSPLLLTGFKEEDVRQITVVDKNERRVFKRTSDGWLLVYQNNQYNADSKKIQENLKRLLEIRRYQRVSANKEKFADFEVQDEQFHVILEGENSRQLARIQLGKTASGYTSTLVRLYGEDSVFSAKGSLRNDWNQELDSYREKSLLRLAKPNIKEVVVSGKKSFKLVDSGTEAGWQLSYNKKDLPADKSKVDNFLSQLADLKGYRFYNNPPPPLAYKVLLILQGNLNKELEIYGPLKEGEYVAKSSDNPFLLTISKYQVENYFGRPEEFEQKSLPNP